MASSKHLHVGRQRCYCDFIPSKIAAYEHRETNSFACGLDLLAVEFGLPS